MSHLVRAEVQHDPASHDQLVLPPEVVLALPGITVMSAVDLDADVPRLELGVQEVVPEGAADPSLAGGLGKSVVSDKSREVVLGQGLDPAVGVGQSLADQPGVADGPAQRK